MNLDRINRVIAYLPILMSLAAFAIVLVVVATGWERGYGDEGAAAHLFQLLMVAQLPMIALVLVTADWRRFGRVGRFLTLQVATIALAVGSVGYFKL